MYIMYVCWLFEPSITEFILQWPKIIFLYPCCTEYLCYMEPAVHDGEDRQDI